MAFRLQIKQILFKLMRYVILFLFQSLVATDYKKFGSIAHGYKTLMHLAQELQYKHEKFFIGGKFQHNRINYGHEGLNKNYKEHEQKY